MPRRLHTTANTRAFGARMRDLRLELDISLARLAEKTGIGKGHLSTIEHGFAAISTESIQRIAKGLDLPPFVLLTFPQENELAAIVDLVRQVPTTRYKRLRKILEGWIAEIEE